MIRIVWTLLATLIMGLMLNSSYGEKKMFNEYPNKKEFIKPDNVSNYDILKNSDKLYDNKNSKEYFNIIDEFSVFNHIIIVRKGSHTPSLYI